MGYFLNALGNLPLDDGVNFYIFLVNGQYRDPIYEMVDHNFAQIAKSIGRSAVVAKGLDPIAFHSEIAAKYFGGNDRSLFDLIPALIITNAHPERMKADTLRLVVPLRDVEERFGGWPRFFASLAKFATGESDEFVHLFQAKPGLGDRFERFVSLKPGMFGISINGNELLKLWTQRKRA